MAERTSRGYAVLAGLLAVQIILVVVYLWPWPGMGMSDTDVQGAPVAAVADTTMIAGLPTLPADPALAVPDAPDVPVGGGPAPTNALTVETAIERGDAVAAEWVEGAAPVAIQLQIDWPQSDVPETVTALADGGWVRFYYLDVEGALPSTLMVLVERTSGEVRETNVEAMASRGETPVDLEPIEVWDTAATLAIEMLGGTAFRAACPTVHYTTLTTLVSDPETGGPVWLVEYPEGREGSRPLVGRVDAITGDATILDPGNTDC
jgi:hypothetical protein